MFWENNVAGVALTISPIEYLMAYKNYGASTIDQIAFKPHTSVLDLFYCVIQGYYYCYCY